MAFMFENLMTYQKEGLIKLPDEHVRARVRATDCRIPPRRTVLPIARRSFCAALQCGAMR